MRLERPGPGRIRRLDRRRADCERVRARRANGANSVGRIDRAVPARVPDQEADTLTGILAPAGTPPAIIAKLNSEIKRAVEGPDVRDKLTVLGFVPVLNTPDEFSVRIQKEMTKWGKVVHDANIKIE